MTATVLSDAGPGRSITLPTDAARYEALARRDPGAEGQFYYSVLTTGVYCRPTCPARLPRVENVAFYPTAEDAERAGYRPCRRCRPRGPTKHERHAHLIESACRLLDSSKSPPPLAKLAAIAGLSAYYFHRLFREHAGMTPRQYASARRLQRVGTGLRAGAGVTAALYEAGYASTGRFYDEAGGAFGMTPSALRRGGEGVEMRAVVSPCSLGHVLVAATDRGVCAIAFGDEAEPLLQGLRGRFPRATVVADGASPAAPSGGPAGDRRGDLADLAARVVAMIEAPGRSAIVPLDLVGTAFQKAVWRVLRDIPAGTTMTYGEVARRVGAPAAVRAVGTACGDNPVAVAVPCHRVVRGDGTLGGYRWGLARKRALLERERRQ